MLTWIVLLYFVGCMLILFEVFLPGLVCGITGGFFVVLSAALAIYVYPENTVWIVVGESVGCVVTVLLGLYLLPRVPFSKKFVAQSELDANRGYVSNISDTSLLGQEGEVTSKLRPVGTIVVDGKRIQAVARGDFIDEGARVRIAEVHGNRVVVDRVTHE